MKPRSIYVHVPFCVRRCSYCDFAVEAMREPPVKRWTDAIGLELGMLRQDQRWDGPLALETLYVGGGTPSMLGIGAMDGLLHVLDPNAALDSSAEWTCEANPESFSPELAEDWLSAGVNRVSLGAQTFDAGSLSWMGRMHGPEGIGRAVRAARGAGFENLSLDLIFGLPSRLDRDWAADLDRLLELDPDHVSLYGLTAEPATPLGRWVRERGEVLADEDRYADEYLLAHEILADAGYEHYEVSNFARPGRRSRHNQVYWSGAPYAALGPGAHAYYPPVRRWNHRSWAGYLESLDACHLPVDDSEEVDRETGRLESIWLGLRTDAGVPFSALTPPALAMVSVWASKGWALEAGETVRLTAAGWLLLDRLSAELDSVLMDGSQSGRSRAIDDDRRLVQISANPNSSDR